MALVLAACVWPLNFFLEGKFDMSWWAFAFPLDALSAAAVTVYSHSRYDAMQVQREREEPDSQVRRGWAVSDNQFVALQRFMVEVRNAATHCYSCIQGS